MMKSAVFAQIRILLGIAVLTTILDFEYQSVTIGLKTLLVGLPALTNFHVRLPVLKLRLVLSLLQSDSNRDGVHLVRFWFVQRLYSPQSPTYSVAVLLHETPTH